MIKYLRVLILIVVVIALGTACTDLSKIETIEPQLSQMQAISELAAMKCYYHNVAKFNEEEAHVLPFFKNYKKFWIEYSGEITIGIDASLVAFELQDTLVKVTIPKAKVLSAKVVSASLNPESFIVEKDSKKPTFEDETKAINVAQENMTIAASEDDALLKLGQQKAQTLLEEYIINIGKAVGRDYTIEWVYLDTDGSK